MTEDRAGGATCPARADVIRVVVVGPGKMAEAIMPDFRLVDGVDVVAVAGRTPTKTRSFADRWGIASAVGVDQLDRVDADICYVASAQSHHMEAAAVALSAGMGALVEKTFAQDLAEAEPVIAAAKRDGRFLMEAMWMRFNPHIRAAADLVAAGEIGEPRLLTAAFGRAIPYDRRHRMWDPAQGGGTLLDQAVYPIALADLFLGPAASVHAIGTTANEYGSDAGVVSEAAVLSSHPGGAQAVSTTSIRAQLVSSATLSGSQGAIIFDEHFWAPGGFTLRSTSGAERRVDTVRDGAGWAPMLRATRDAYAEGCTEHALSPISATVRVLGVLDEARRQIGPG